MPRTDSYEYEYEDLLAGYSSLGVRRGGLIYVAADIGKLLRYRKPGRDNCLNAHLRAFRELLGSTGTIFVPTASLNLCNSSVPFDLQATPSKDMGVFAEFVRTRPEAVRSFHPFWSLAGIGPAAGDFLNDISRHAYGWGSVFQRFVEHDVLGINIGKSPHYSISVIHHIETIVGVPYRYTKEFIHPVIRGSKVVFEPFYLSVLYRQSDIVRDQNRKILANFAARSVLREVAIGRGRAWSFSHSEFSKITADYFVRDIYAWLNKEPTLRPYQS